MKTFIVMAAALPVLASFVAQFLLERRNHDRVAALEEWVYEAKERAKREGRFTDEGISELKRAIAGRFETNESEIRVETREETKHDPEGFCTGTLLHYRIDVPLRRLAAGNGPAGLFAGEAAGRYVIEGRTLSERT